MLGVLVGLALVVDKRSSEPILWLLLVLPAIGFPIVILFLMIAEKWKVILNFALIPLILGYLAYHSFHWIYWPSNIRFGFHSPSRASGTYHVVRFYHQIGDQWIDGPSVEGWPMTVSFPDINSDGYEDIRVMKKHLRNEGAIEFVFLPHAMDGIHWKSYRTNAKLSATYKPAGFFLNQP